MSRSAALHVIVLAAGAATRFGSPKQLARVDGQPLLAQVISRAIEVGGASTTVVIGAHAAEIAPVVNRSNVTLIINRQWQEGIGSSIRAAMERAPSGCDGAMLLLADQINVSAQDLRQLADVWRRQKQCIVAAQYAGALGVPAVFPRADFRALSELRGDRGAQALIRRNPERLVAVPMPNAALDIDTPEDLLMASKSSTSPSTT
jgi:molybdenum cofactor cytidylyltransferase